MPKTSTRSRKGKINFKTRIPIYTGSPAAWDDDGPDSDTPADTRVSARSPPAHSVDASSVSPAHSHPRLNVETGVDKDEESEHHLVVAIAASQANLRSAYIPTPDATGKVSSYDSLYPKVSFPAPITYLRYSDTLEDTLPISYNLDEADDLFLKSLHPANHHHLNNANNPNTSSPRSRKLRDSVPPPSANDFELIMDTFERLTDERVPLLSLDLNRIPSFQDFEPAFTSPQLAPLRHWASVIYPHWKSRRLQKQGKSLVPQLDYDESQDQNPYVCFRRRDLKTARKTRRTDAQNLERIAALRADLAAIHTLFASIVDREQRKLDSLTLDKSILLLRSNLRSLKRRLGGDTAGDDDLLLPREKKKKKANNSAAAIATGHPDQQSANVGANGLRIPLRISRSNESPGPTSTSSLDTPDSAPPTASSLPTIAEPLLPYKDKLPHILQRIERDLTRKKEHDKDWEDWSDMAYLPLPLSTPAKFWRPVEYVDVPPLSQPQQLQSQQQAQQNIQKSENNEPTSTTTTTSTSTSTTSPSSSPFLCSDTGRVRAFGLGHHHQPPIGPVRASFRKRIGRGGRILLDRIPRPLRSVDSLYTTSSSSSSSSEEDNNEDNDDDDDEHEETNQEEKERKLSIKQLVKHEYKQRQVDRWKYDADTRDFHAFDGPTVIDDFDTKYSTRRVQIYNAGDLESLVPSSAFLNEAAAWLRLNGHGPTTPSSTPSNSATMSNSDATNKMPLFQIVGAITGKPSPNAPPPPPLIPHQVHHPQQQQQSQQHSINANPGVSVNGIQQRQLSANGGVASSRSPIMNPPPISHTTPNPNNNTPTPNSNNNSTNSNNSSPQLANRLPSNSSSTANSAAMASVAAAQQAQAQAQAQAVQAHLKRTSPHLPPTSSPFQQQLGNAVVPSSSPFSTPHSIIPSHSSPPPPQQLAQQSQLAELMRRTSSGAAGSTLPPTSSPLNHGANNTNAAVAAAAVANNLLQQHQQSLLQAQLPPHSSPNPGSLGAAAGTPSSSAGGAGVQPGGVSVGGIQWPKLSTTNPFPTVNGIKGDGS